VKPMKDPVLDILKTTYEASELTRALHALLQVGTTDKKVLASEAERLLSHSLAKALIDQINDTKDVQIYLKTLLASMNKLEVIHLGLAFEPSGDLVEKLSLWIDKNLGEAVVIDFELKPQLIGGASISYKGRYGDYSLSKKIDEYLEIKRQEKFGNKNKIR